MTDAIFHYLTVNNFALCRQLFFVLVILQSELRSVLFLHCGTHALVALCRFL